MAGAVEPSANEANQAASASVSLPWSVGALQGMTARQRTVLPINVVFSAVLQVGEVHSMEANEHSRKGTSRT